MLWTEKYRPTRLAQIVGQDSFKMDAENWVLLKDMPNLLLYGYGSYGNSISPSFSSTNFSLIDRKIIWATAHIRGGMEKGMKWWKVGKLTNKKNTFEDYIYAAKFLIDNKYLRRLSTKELNRVCGFPDNFKIPDGVNKYDLYGNMVIPTVVDSVLDVMF